MWPASLDIPRVEVQSIDAMKIPRPSLFTLSCAVVLAACGGGTEPSNNTSGNNNSTSATLSGLTVSLTVSAAAMGEEIQAQVKGRYSDATEKDLTAQATWSSGNTAVLEPVADRPGVFLAVGEGTADIVVAFEGKMGTSAVTVGPARMMSLELVPPDGDFGYGGHLNIAVIAHNSDGSRDLVTDTVTWKSSRTNVAIASAQEKGRLVSFGEGTTTITAELGELTVSGEYTVTAARVEYLTLTPENVRVGYDAPVQFSATAVYTDHDPTGVGHVEDITASVVWSSSDETVLVIDANGLATAVGDGDVVVTASKDGVSASTIARTVSIACPYPADHDTGVTYDTVLPPLFWLDAYRQDGSTEDFRMEQAFCNAETYKTILFVIGAGWCPYCPDYMRAVNERAADLEAAGSLVVYVEIETAGGAPANNQQANAIVDHEVATANGPSFRVGDGVVQGGVNQPFSRAVSAIPSAFIVRTSDMRVIASQARSSSTLDWVRIAQDPSRLY